MCPFFIILNGIHKVEIFFIVLEYLVLIGRPKILAILVILVREGVALRLAVERNTRYFISRCKWRGTRLSAAFLEVRSSPSHYPH